MSVGVRQAEPGDRDAWRALFLDYGVFYETAFDDAVLDGVWAWLLDPAHELRCFVAEQDGRVLGFAHVRSQADTFTAGPGWFLDDLYVAPEARGLGLATHLIEALTEHAATNGGGTIRWITAADNTTAQSVYDKLATKTSWVTYEKEPR